MGEARGPDEDRYQLPEGTYRELIVKDRMTKFLKEQLTTLRQELREGPRPYPHEDRGLTHAEEQARVKAAADLEVATGRPIVVLAWQVLVTRYAHKLAAAPSWLSTPATAAVRVFADDTCEPASS
jgi:hypothetical protein